MYYGLDVHKDFIQVCRLSGDGRQRLNFPIPATSKAIEAFAGTLSSEDQVALEVTFHMIWVRYTPAGSSCPASSRPSQRTEYGPKPRSTGSEGMKRQDHAG